jgi:hypothetical protein
VATNCASVKSTSAFAFKGPATAARNPSGTELPGTSGLDSHPFSTPARVSGARTRSVSLKKVHDPSNGPTRTPVNRGGSS